jgi:hypothetical protein
MGLSYEDYLATKKKPSLLFSPTAKAPDFSAYKAAPVAAPAPTVPKKSKLSYEAYLTQKNPSILASTKPVDLNANKIQLPTQSKPVNQSTAQGPKYVAPPELIKQAVNPPKTSLSNPLEKVVFKIAKDMAQGTARSYAALSANVLSPDKKVTPKGPVDKLIFGTDQPFGLKEQQPFFKEDSKFATPLAAAFVLSDSIPGVRALKTAISTKGIQGVLHAEDIAYATKLVHEAKNTKKIIPTKDITVLRGIFESIGIKLPESNAKALDFVETMIKSGEKKAGEIMTAKITSTLPTGQTTQDIVAKSTYKPQAKSFLQVLRDQVTGQFQGMKKLATEQGERGFVKNPFQKGEGAEDLSKAARQGESYAKTTPEVLPKGTLDLSKGRAPLERLPSVGGEISSFYNTERLNIPQAGKEAIESEIKNAGKVLEKTVGTTLTNKEVIDRAAMSSKVLNTTVTRAQTEAKIAANLKLRQEIADAANTGKVDEDFIDLWIKDKAAGEDIARQLQARKIKADPQTASAIDDLLAAIYKENKNADEIIKAAKGVNFDNPEEVIKFFRTFVKPKVGDWIDVLRYNSMLSSPTTHLVNISSNFQGVGILAPIEKTITGGLDAIKSAVTGSPREYYAGEGAAFAKGFYSNLGKAAKNMWGVMSGKNISSNVDVYRIPLSSGGFPRVAENVLQFPSRLLEAADQFFTTLTEAGVKSANDLKLAKGAEAGNAAEEAAKRLFKQRLGSKDEGYLLDAIEFIPKVIQKARSSDNGLVKWTSKLVFPFINIGTQLLKQGIEYGPAGLLTLPGNPTKIEQISKFAIGSAVATGVATLAASDRLTWAEPANAEQKNAFRASGMQPYSVKIGENWVSYAKLHPAIAWNFALVSAVKDSLERKKLDDTQADTILQTAAKYMNFFADQSYMKQVGDIVSASKGDSYGVTRFVSNFPSQFIPFRALMGWIERIVDPVQRQADPDGTKLEKQIQTIMAQIPGLAYKVPPRLGPDGQPIPIQNPILNALSPMRITTERHEAADAYRNSFKFKKLVQQNADRRADEKEQMQPVYDEVQSLIAQGKEAEARKIVDGLTDEEYATYKKIKASQKSKATIAAEEQMLPQYLEIQEMIANDEEDEAKAIVNNMSDEEYRIYKLLKARFQ